MNRPTAIGMFDSGVGGLGILRHAIDQVDGIALLYAADAAHAPYGARAPRQVRARCVAITRFLIEQGAGAIVVACNTATAIAIDTLRAEFDLPVIGIEPALKPAAARTLSGRVGLLATPGTLGSGRYTRLRAAHGDRIEVLERDCRGWVEAVEAGELDSPRVFDLVHAELAPLHAAGVDCYVLGCTHFPFLIPTIRGVVGEAVEIIDPGQAVVVQLRRRLQLGDAAAVRSAVRLFSSGAPQHLRQQTAQLIGLDAPAEALPV